MDWTGEDRLTAWIRQILDKKSHNRIGDDGAILPSGPSWTVTIDQQIEGVHFPKSLAPRLIAMRLLAVNLSDLAAMGAQPSFALLALSFPESFGVKGFFRALIGECEKVGVELAGGDLARSSSVSATMTLFGRREQGGHWLRRSNAQPGDELWVGGPLGRSATGLRLVEQGAFVEGNSIVLPASLEDAAPPVVREAKKSVRAYLSPSPQLELGLWLARRRRAAAIDISDGLSLDLHRLCRESHVGAEIFAEDLPLEAGLVRLQRLIGLDPLATALEGGEDYVLLFSLPVGTTLPPEFGCQKIGRCVGENGINLIQGGQRTPLAALGWDHFRSD